MTIAVVKVTSGIARVVQGENTAEATRQAAIATAAAAVASGATQTIVALMARASLYALGTALTAAAAFATEGVEADFTEDYYRDGTTVGDDLATLPGWAVTRALAGYVERDGALVSVPADEARTSSDGLLVEPARTNVLLHSQDFSNAAWIKASVAVDANAVAAPDGTMTADKVKSTGSGAGVILQQPTLTAAGWTFTVYAKMAERRYLVLNYQATGFDNLTFFDLQAGAVGYVNGDSVASIEALDDGWYRCRVTRTATAGVRTCAIQHSSTDAVVSASTAGHGVYLWGAQCELGGAPSSYVPTAGAAVARPADDPRLTWAPGARGTLYFEFTMPRVQNEFTVGALQSTGAASPVLVDNGAVQSTNGATTLAPGFVGAEGDTVRAVLTWGPEGRTFAVNGVAASDAQDIGAIATLTVGGAGSMNGFVRRLVIIDGETLSENDALLMSGGTDGLLAAASSAAGATAKTTFRLTYDGFTAVSAGQVGDDGYVPGSGFVRLETMGADWLELGFYAPGPGAAGAQVRSSRPIFEFFLSTEPTDISDLSVRGIAHNNGTRVNARNGDDTGGAVLFNVLGVAGVMVQGATTTTIGNTDAAGGFDFKTGVDSQTGNGGTLVGRIREEGLTLKQRAAAPVVAAGYSTVWAKNDGTLQRTSNVGGVTTTKQIAEL